MSEEDLLAEWKGRKVTEVHRITRPTLDGGREKTNTLILTIFGTTIPEHLFVGPIRIPTRIFYPAPMVCFQCLQYGHSKTRCKSKEVCPNCSKSAHVAEGERCIEPAYCRNCEGPHSASSRDCPAYKIEKEIMRIKVEQGISFNEARKNYNARNALTSFANIVKESTSTIKTDNENALIAQLRDENTKLKTQLKVQQESLVKDNHRIRENQTKMRDVIIELQKSVLELKQGNQQLHEKFIKEQANMQAMDTSNKITKKRRTQTPNTSPERVEAADEQNDMSSTEILLDISDEETAKTIPAVETNKRSPRPVRKKKLK
ncbi:uncharacterized protein LOC131695532 [Topomyia yanbarensis]|uniref:uncharacterized protein LOC131695532 n=1 Tax=Topomyia yanbarensis TaxID=2498891 RepID=UPI00273BEFF3|nr:uncharacterized protein LOC131695532 [Topomyia yanbarensis]